jgi:hypothetical protein
MSKIWSYTTIFFAGAFVAMVMVFLKQKPQTVISAETYIEDQEQKIGKIKQKGQGNAQEAALDQAAATTEQSSKTKKESRKAKRLSRKSKK